jgi:hypothetical protein
MIVKTDIEKYFSELQEDATLNLNQALSWGFFFTSKEKEKLEKAKELFLKEEYDFVEIVPFSGDYYLHLEKVETNNVDTLYKRCSDLNELAEKFGIDKFNGFDVEEIGFR